MKGIACLREADGYFLYFSNHARQTLPFRFAIASGGTRTADLPGDVRDLTYVEFYYQKGSWSNKPEVQLFGRP